VSIRLESYTNYTEHLRIRKPSRDNQIRRFMGEAVVAKPAKLLLLRSTNQ